MRHAPTLGLLAALLLAGAACGAEQANSDASTLELTTLGRKSGQPRTATIWFVYDAGQLFVQSGRDGKTDWYLNLLEDPAVTVKIGERSMPGRARPVENAAETARVHQLFKQKYLSARVMSWFGGGFGTGKVVAVDGVTLSD